MPRIMIERKGNTALNVLLVLVFIYRGGGDVRRSETTTACTATAVQGDTDEFV